MSPSGLFDNLTAAERATLRASALQRIASGERTSLSGGGKGGSRQWQMTPQDVLFELNSTAQILGEVAPRAQTVTQDMTDFYGCENQV